MFVKRPTFLFASLILVFTVIIPYWKLALMQGLVITDDIFTSDIMNDAFPARYYLSEILKSGSFPLWIPHIYGGFPLLARAEAGVCYPINLLVFGLLSPYAALNLVILLTLMTAALGMYAYIREINGTFAAGLIGGVAFAFSGYIVSHIKHLSNVNAACWLPLGLVCIERGLRKNDPKYFVFLALIFGLQHLSGHTQVAYYSGILYVVYFIFRHRMLRNQGAQGKNPNQSNPKVRMVLFCAGGLVLGSGMGAVQLLPTYELVSLSQRAGGVTFDYAANYAYDPSNVFTFIYPYINGDIGAGTYTGNSIFWEDYGYVGVTVLALALYAVIRQWRSAYVKMFTITAVVSYILVLGPNTPFYEAVFHLVPGMNYFRFPTRFLLITNLSLIILGAIGATHLSQRFGKQRIGPFSRGDLVIFSLVVADLWYFQLRQNPIVNIDDWLRTPQTAELIRSKEGKGNGAFRIYVLGGSESHKLAFAKARGWQGDLQPYIDQREFLQPSSNVLYGFSTPDGYANLTPNYLVEIWGDQNRGGLVFQTASLQENRFVPTPAFWKLMSMYNVKYILSLWPIMHEQEARPLGKIGEVFLYEHLDALPRAYLVGNTKTVRNIDDAKRLMISPEFDPQNEVLLYETVQMANSGRVSGDVTLTSYTANEVVMHVSTKIDAMLVFSDSYYPGWKAFIGDEELNVLQANVTQRAILVPAGEHVVRFVFESEPVTRGLWITGFSMIFMAIFLILFLMRRSHETQTR